MDITIDPRIRDLFPPLTDEEFANLEREILDDGKINEPLVTYDGVLLDGHHRYKIAKKHNIPYEVIEKDFADWGDALGWARRHQKARRNLNKTQDALLVADIEELVANIRAEAREKQSEAGGDHKSNAYQSKQNQIAFPDVRKSDSSQQQQQASTAPAPQPTVPIQAVHMPEPTVRESAHQQQVTAPEAKSNPIHTNKILAERANVGHDTMDKVMAVKKHGDPELVEKMRSGEISANKAYQTVRREKKAAEVRMAQSIVGGEHAKGKSVLYVGDSIGRTVECDLLLTDPPYSTDIEDIDEFVGRWLCPALEGVKSDGFAYVFIGAYPDELRAYLNAKTPDHIELCQVLVWTYKNTLGNNPKGRYKQNWQACLFYRGKDAPNLDCPLTSEQWAVQEVNAPDGRLGDRYHAWQKPLELCERFVRHSTEEGDVVYDPFACTGTTLVAAARLGRNGVGYEIDRENAEVAFERGVVRGGDV